MDDPPRLQVAHALGHLAGEVQQDWQAQGPALGACGEGQPSGGWRLPGDTPLCLRCPIHETGEDGSPAKPAVGTAAPGTTRGKLLLGSPEGPAGVGDTGAELGPRRPRAGAGDPDGPAPTCPPPSPEPRSDCPSTRPGLAQTGDPEPTAGQSPPQPRGLWKFSFNDKGPADKRAGVCPRGQGGVATHRPQEGPHSLPRKACRLPLLMSSVTRYTGSPTEHTACSRMRRSWCRLLSVCISLARSASFMLAAGGRGEAQGPPPPPAAARPGWASPT